MCLFELQAAAADQIRQVANKKNYEQMRLTDLAVLSRRVADDRSMDRAMAEKALKLKVEWTKLEEPPPRIFKEQKELERQQAVFKTQMVEFLLGI